ncbi:hypothetical protein [Hadaka virus 1]|uniref:Uncharacterized protein n=1 Tax=Hadaka virus 1 TaxID=2703488 RepID=A0A6J4BJH3_9VIRU|nr:hypothetical protein QK729_s6gp1 [Hadaka virus 1]BBU94043.1 hypothetical protein [Hadaka virus 1]
MSSNPVKVRPSNLGEHARVRGALKVVKDEKVCIYRNGLLKGLMNGDWSVVSRDSTWRFESDLELGVRVYYIHNPVRSEADSEVFEVGGYDQIPSRAWEKDQSDYLILKVLV